MKTIVFFSPVSLKDRLESGISIRMDQLEEWFQKEGFRTIRVDKVKSGIFEKADFFYVMVSTHANSISSQAVRVIPTDKQLIIDLYTPIFLEKDLSFDVFSPHDWLMRFQKKQVVKKIIQRGNHFLVANRRQKNYWLQIAQKMKVKIGSKDISVIPTGASVPSTVNRQPSTVILWFGGIYPWLEPKPLIEAFSPIAPKYPDWKLRVLGGFHPKTGYLKIYKDVISLAHQIIKRNQLEIIPWQSKYSLNKYLKDVAFAVHLPKDIPEDFYAHRARLLTLTNSAIGIVTSGKDVISQLIVKEKAGEYINLNTSEIATKLKSLIESPAKFSLWQRNAELVQQKFIRREKQVKLKV